MTHLRSLAALLLLALLPTASSHAGPRSAPGQETGAAERAQQLLAAEGSAREAALNGLSSSQRIDVSQALNEVAERLRLAGQTADALAAARLSVDIAERSGDERVLARALSRLGTVTNSRGEFTDSIALLQRSIELSRRLDERPTLAEALGTLSYAWFIRGDLAASLAASTESLTIRRGLGLPADIATSLNFVAMAERQRGNYDVAIAHYEEAAALAERVGAELQMARTLNNMAVAERERGNNDRSIELYLRSIEIAQRAGNRAGAANTLSNLGMSYEDIGRNDLALDAYLKSLATTDAIGDRVNSANTLGNLGYLYHTQGNDALALDYFRRSLEIYEQIGHTEGIARILDFRARVHTLRREYTLAEPLYRRALELRRTVGDRAGLANIELELGWFYEAQGDLARALLQYQQGTARLDEIGERRSLSYALLRLAAVRNKRGEYQAALVAAARATEAAEATGQDARRWETELAAGRAWRGLQDRDRAVAAFERAIAGVERLRESTAGVEEDRELAFEQQVDPYREMVSLLADTEPVTALRYAERAKGRVLLDVLRHGRVDVTKAMTAGEREQERRLSSAIVVAAQRMQREQQRRSGDAAAIADAERGLNEARARAEEFRAALYTSHPELRGQRSEAPAVGLDDLAALVGDEATALVEFVVAPDATFAFVVTKGAPVEITAHRIARLPEGLERLIDDFTSALARRDLGFRSADRAVSNAILGPLGPRLRGRTRLIVVPDGPLWDLPFQALLSADGRFLVERFTVSYAPSLTALREVRGHGDRGATRPRAVAAFGDPRVTGAVASNAGAVRADDLVPLPAAAREARALGGLYGAGSRVWVGTEATEARFKSDTGPFPILHVATHGILNNADPMSSHLLLSPSNGQEAGEDGRLQARELLALDLQADLAVLSGCDTAKGRTGSGEGVIGLTWALFVAGVPTTVVSQWQVDSESTERLMVGLHRRLASAPSTTPADALRASARAMLATDRYRHPFYWAGFVVVGDGQRPLR